LDNRYFESGRAICKSVGSQRELEHGMAILRTLHQRRRINLGEPGCFASAPFDRFLTEAARRFLATGELRLHWIELDGRPIAVQIAFVSGGTYFHYQSGMEPDAMADNPGWLVQIATIKAAMADGLSTYDFLRGDEPYKAAWRAERRELAELRIVGRHTSARLRYCIWLSGLRIKNWFRDVDATPWPEESSSTPGDSKPADAKAVVPS
jgi:CelD/BcsL family acetyltransferase involved in cellulose biosynthesis